MVNFGAYSILSLFGILKVFFSDFLKDFCFIFHIKSYKKKFANLSTSLNIEDIEEVTAKTILIFF